MLTVNTATKVESLTLSRILANPKSHTIASVSIDSTGRVICDEGDNAGKKRLEMIAGYLTKCCVRDVENHEHIDVILIKKEWFKPKHDE